MPYFYPRSPCGERRQNYILGVSTVSISIHALLAESDLDYTPVVDVRRAFLSTLSLRRATPPQTMTTSVQMISIHALLAESDHCGRSNRNLLRHFYPRSPCGERPGALAVVRGERGFLSTLSLRRATPYLRGRWPSAPYFYPRSPCGERQGFFDLEVIEVVISIHALLAESDSAPN